MIVCYVLDIFRAVHNIETDLLTNCFICVVVVLGAVCSKGSSDFHRFHSENISRI
jgi:hypothetical protein